MIGPRGVLLAAVMLAIVGAGFADGASSSSVAAPTVPQVFLVDANGQHVRQLTGGRASHGSVLWLPGGGAVVDLADRGEGTWVETQRVNRGRARVLSEKFWLTAAYGPVLQYSPVSRLTAVELDQLNGVIKLELAGAPGRRRTTLDTFPETYAPDPPSWSPNGRLIAYSRPSTRRPGPEHVFVVDRYGGRPRPITSGSKADLSPSFSPSGRSILFYRTADRLSGALYTVPLAGGRPRRISPSIAEPTAAWSPDGRQIAFTGYLNGNPYPYLFDLDVITGTLRKLAGSVQLLTPAWSPSSTEIAFATWPTAQVPPPTEGYAAVEIIRRDGTKPQVLVRVPRSQTDDLTWSPNRRTIAFTLATQAPES